jgi:hypothetical protein
LVTLSQQNISFLNEELDIRSPRLVPIIAYPRFSESEYKNRIIEMDSLGITSIILDGKTIVNGSPIAGKGCVGIVVKAKAGSKVCALKIRRTDANRKTMDNEVRFHKIANSACIGPRLEGHTKNLIAMEFVTGQSIIDWVIGNKATKSKICTLVALTMVSSAGLHDTSLFLIDHISLTLKVQVPQEKYAM